MNKQNRDWEAEFDKEWIHADMSHGGQPTMPWWTHNVKAFIRALLETERETCLGCKEGVFYKHSCTPTKMSVPERLSPYNGLIHGSLNATLDKINEIIDYLEATKEK